jgi:hypothetical protein
LLIWQEQPDPLWKSGGLLLAPIPASNRDDPDPTYRASARIHADKERLETLRLFYVAVTRARQNLHLLGHAERRQDGLLAPAVGSLLKAGWVALAEAAKTGVIAAKQVTGSSLSGMVLRRLPIDWTPPQPVSAVPMVLPGIRRASDAGYHAGKGVGLSLRTEEGRIVGTTVHVWLERLAVDGVENWTNEKLLSIRSVLREQMLGNGVPHMRIDVCVERALTALTKVLHSPRGRWILAAHQGAACEVTLTGMLDGMLVHAVIDRTFVDTEGVRWVIDYKTSVPGDGEPTETFVNREREQYTAQLVDYARLLALQEPQRVVRAALYFTPADIWCEIG